MATFRQILNRTLVALGQADNQVADGANSLTDAYHIKVAQWVNDFLEEVEDAAPWRVLRQAVSVTVAQGTLSSAITGATPRSKLIHSNDADNGIVQPLVSNQTTPTQPYMLTETDLPSLLAADRGAGTTITAAYPDYFAVEPSATGMNLYVYPRPASTQTIQVELTIPQGRVDTSSSASLDTIIKVPDTLVVLGATWWGLEDRGEELGQDGSKAEARYRMKLAEAAAAELAVQGLDDLVVRDA